MRIAMSLIVLSCIGLIIFVIFYPEYCIINAYVRQFLCQPKECKQKGCHIEKCHGKKFSNKKCQKDMKVSKKPEESVKEIPNESMEICEFKCNLEVKQENEFDSSSTTRSWD